MDEPHESMLSSEQAGQGEKVANKAKGSGFDGVGGSVPGDHGPSEVRFVGHVARERGVVAEDGVFGDLLMVAHTLEESPQVRFFLVPGSGTEVVSLADRFLAGL